MRKIIHKKRTFNFKSNIIHIFVFNEGKRSVRIFEKYKIPLNLS